MSLTVHLSRGAGWQAYSAGRGRLVLVTYSCPFCREVNTIDNSRIAADGTVELVAICPTALCHKTYRVVLRGWRSRSDERTPQIFPAPFTLTNN